MRENIGQIAFAVSVLIFAVAEVLIAVIANMLFFHSLVMTFKHHIALVTPKVSVIVVAIADLLVASFAIMLGRGLVFAIDNSKTTVAIVVFVLVYMITNKFSAAFRFVAVAVVVIVEATGGNPYTAPVAGVIAVRVLMVGGIGIFFTFRFLAADVASSVLILIHMGVALQLVTAFVAQPIAVGICAYVGHPAVTFITIVIAIPVHVILAGLLHTVSRSVAILASAVVGPVVAIIA